MKSASAAALGVGLGATIITDMARANPNTLRILRWKNFVPAFETWFNEDYVRIWGAENDIEVIVDNVGLGDINRLAAQEASAGEGHDLIQFLSPRAGLEDHVIDHREIFEECQSLYGKAPDAVFRSFYNPKTKKHHGFGDSYLATLTTYRKDLWDAVGQTPKTWEDVRKGGRAIKLLHDTPVGISLATEHNGKHILRAIMYAFGAHVQDEDGRPAINSGNTLEALKFVKALYEEAMFPDVLNWAAPSNNQFMLAGSGSLTIDTMSIIRAAENTALPVNANLALAPLPEGPVGNSGPMFGINSYVIWKFAKNKTAAQKFLLDYVGRFQQGFLTSGFQNMPIYPGSVPDFKQIIQANTSHPGRYDPLLNVDKTMTNLGAPGYSNAAIDEVMSQGLVPKMFAAVAAGQTTPQDAAEQAQKAIVPIFDKWRNDGKI